MKIGLTCNSCRNINMDIQICLRMWKILVMICSIYVCVLIVTSLIEHCYIVCSISLPITVYDLEMVNQCLQGTYVFFCPTCQNMCCSQINFMLFNRFVQTLLNTISPTVSLGIFSSLVTKCTKYIK